ncbi:UNVERIFIED_CONTAM: hypothetical protein K2H54_055584 [Gekko kuhli]
MEFTHQGKTHKIATLEDGKSLLRSLNLETPMDVSLRLQKRRLDAASPPPAEQNKLVTIQRRLSRLRDHILIKT